MGLGLRSSSPKVPFSPCLSPTLKRKLNEKCTGIQFGITLDARGFLREGP